MKPNNLYARTIDERKYDVRKPNNVYLRDIVDYLEGGGSTGGLDFIELVITYSDGTTENVNFGIVKNGE